MKKPLDDKTSVVLHFDKGGRRSHLQLGAHPQLAEKYGIITSPGSLSPSFKILSVWSWKQCFQNIEMVIWGENYGVEGCCENWVD